jgi:hypothetical protein
MSAIASAFAITANSPSVALLAIVKVCFETPVHKHLFVTLAVAVTRVAMSRSVTNGAFFREVFVNRILQFFADTFNLLFKLANAIIRHFLKVSASFVAVSVNLTCEFVNYV